jgi:hypothetical protein
VQLLQLKASSLIFVDVRDLTLIVSGKTRHRRKALGFDGMRFKWDRDRQKWYGPLTLRNLEALDRWPEAELSPEARLAKVTLKDTREAKIPEAELMEACDSIEQVSWKIIFFGQGKGRD